MYCVIYTSYGLNISTAGISGEEREGELKGVDPRREMGAGEH